MVAKTSKRVAKRSRRAKSAPEPPTKVVYLFGAGATQAEVSYDGPGNVSLLMGDTNDFPNGIATAVLDRLGPKGESFKADKNPDIEKLISLLTASGIDKHLEVAEDMRQYYFEEICTR